MGKYMYVLKKKRFYFFLFSVIAFLIISILILKKGILNIDSSFYQLIKDELISDKLTPLIKIVTNLGSGLFLIFITIIVAYLLKDKKKSMGISINLVLAFLMNILLKNIFQRERPLLENRLIHEMGYSFPSGHSMVSMAFYGFLIYLIYVYIDRKRYKYPLIILLSIIILIIGFSRIYLGVHYLSDVLAGFLISIAYLILFVYFFNKFIKVNPKIKKIYIK